MKLLERIKVELNRITVLRSLKFRMFLIIMLVGLLCCFVMRFGIMQSYFNSAVQVRTVMFRIRLKFLPII